MNTFVTEEQSISTTIMVAPNVARASIGIVNVYFIKTESSMEDSWILVDAGMGNCAQKIIKHAKELLNTSKPPKAIILTHGHFDHTGALEDLIELWDVPIYAHIKEFPYLTGKSHYPPPDPTVGGGAMSLFSFLYPTNPINLGIKLKKIPNNGIIPELPEWKVIETPGHSPGHISLFRDSDRTLIAGDAIVTVKQESALSVIRQTQQLHGPPAYFTCDWIAAKTSVEKLAALEPEVAATGHGIPMRGAKLKSDLKLLAKNFDNLSKPTVGRYVNDPAQTNERGIFYLPPASINNGTIATVLIGALTTLILIAFLRNGKD